MLQIKPVRYHCTPTKMAKTKTKKTLAIPNAVKNVKQQQLSFTAGGNGKWYTHFRRQVCWFLTKLYILTIHSYSLGVSYVNKPWHAVTIRSNNHALSYLPK